MPEIKITIPDGVYCYGCPMMEHYNTPLVNMFGDPTGNFRSGYRCNRFRCDLEVEHADCGWYERSKKCCWCTMTEEQRTMAGLMAFMVLKKIDAPDGEKNESKEAERMTGNERKFDVLD